MKNYTDEQLLSKVKSLPSFSSIPAGWWLLGVRSELDIPNRYDDKIYLFKGEVFSMVTTATTNPGTPILKGGYLKYNNVGAAVVKADEWYHNVWQPGRHMGKMQALIQTGAKITVYRDGNGNDKSEEVGKPISGYYGINFHANDYNMNSRYTKEEINGWSAGCQVVNNIPKYVTMIDRIGKQKNITYVIINEF